MEHADYQRWTEELESKLSSREDVLGLILVGSTAGTARAPDQHSDHDFFVVAHEAHAERLRRELDWAPYPERIVLAHRETPHGAKLLYDDGHIAELAVFAPPELHWARGDTWLVVFDRGLELERVMRANAASAVRAPLDRSWNARQILFLLLVGAARWRRGERLSGHRLVFGEALSKLVALLAALEPPADAALDDPFDALRRLHRSRPALSAELEQTLTWPADVAARQLLGLLARYTDGRPEALPPHAVRVAVEALR